jgi:energy-coupling factor transporter ATP-binding protein EcfA2
VLSQAVTRGQIERVTRGRYQFVDGESRETTKGRPRRTTPPLVWLRFQKFGVFEDVEFKFCPGVNVLIGENGTGKSHAMMAAYSILRAFHKDDTSRGVAARVEEKLKGAFQPENRRLGRLVRRARGGGVAHIGVESGSFSCEVQFNHKDPDSFELLKLQRRPTGSSIFIPSREVLAMYEGFIGAYTRSDLAFSEVYYDTCVSLNAPLTRGAREQEVLALLAPLLEVLGGRVFEKGGRFYVQQGAARLEAHLVSEGLRKIATLVHLVNNGSLKSNDLLFWDEPEANLNPALSKIVVNFLLALAKQGVQVILATHDFSVTTRLSILAENAVVPAELIRFFSLARAGSKTSAVEVCHANTLAGLPANPILDEHEALYDFDVSGGAQ